jgi:hypothetical protein
VPLNSITLEEVNQYRLKNFHQSSGDHLQTSDQAVDFVNQRGFILFWPDPKMDLPNLWQAVAGKRSVPDNHDDPGHITWNWKDSLLEKKVWYYARIIRHRNTMISMDLIPYFYALSPNFGSPEEDIHDQYMHGEIPLEAKLIFEALLDKGPLDTISLRKESHLSSSSSTQPFTRALNILQRDLKVLPTGIAEAGAWRYAFRYDLTHRYFPDLIENAHNISETAARTKLITTHLDSVGAASAREVAAVFSWTLELTLKFISSHAGSTWQIGNLPTNKGTEVVAISAEFLERLKA